jgi:hypothetical protein
MLRNVRGSHAAQKRRGFYQVHLDPRIGQI